MRERCIWKRNDFIMRESPLFIHKNFTPLAKMADTYFTLAILHLADTKNKILTVTNGLFFIIGRHTFTILFYIWLIFSRHKTIDTKNKILLLYTQISISPPFFVWIFFDVACFISFVIIPNQLLVLRYFLRYTWSIYDLGVCCW